MGAHSAPDVTTEDFDFTDELVPLVDDVWDDLVDDGHLEKETIDRAKHVGISLVHGLVVAVGTAVGPALYHEIAGGNVNPPSLAKLAGTLALAAIVSYVRPKK